MTLKAGRCTLSISIIAIAAVICATPQGIAQQAPAITIIDIDSFTCEPDFSGTWDGSTATCTLDDGIYIHGTQDVNVPPGVTAVLPGFKAIYIEDIRTLSVEGTLVVTRSGQLVATSTGGVDVNNGGNITILDNDDMVVTVPAIDLSGILKINNGTVSVGNHSDIWVHNGGLLNVHPDGILNIHGGDVVVDNSGTLVVYGDISVTDSGRLLAINGGLVYMTGDLDITDGGVVGVDPSSDLLVYFDGILDINTDGHLIVEGELNIGTPNGIIHIRYGGRLFVNNDGIVIVNPGAVLGINDGGTLSNSGGIYNSGTMYNDCGSFDNQGEFTGNPFADIDSDEDGLFDSVDISDCLLSTTFSDTELDGATTGAITSAGSQLLAVTDAPYPGGIEIMANASGGATPAQFNVCEGAAIYSLGAGADIITTCGSVTTHVIRGSAGVELVDAVGSTAFASVDAGFTLTFDPLTFSFTAPASNPGSISITAGGLTFEVGPGQTIHAPVHQLPGDCNQDGQLDISDASCILGVLFTGTPQGFACGDGSPTNEANVSLIDWQRDGVVDISDGVALLQYLFAGGAPHASGSECLAIEGCPAACK